MSQRRITAFAEKEWIKLRHALWILPVLVLYAAGDTLLNLHTMSRVYGQNGLWEVVVFKQPLFFSSYRLVILCGIVTGFLLTWTETRNKRLRLMFHMPLRPELMISQLLFSGLLVMIVVNTLLYLLLTVSLKIYHFPGDILYPVLLTVLPWSILSIIAYLLTTALLLAPTLRLKLLNLILAYASGSLMLPATTYNQSEPALWFYAIVSGAVLFAVYFSALSFLNKPIHLPLYNISAAVTTLTVSVMLSTVLPDFFSKAFQPPRIHSIMHFSPVYNEFVYSRSDMSSSSPTRYFREDGREISRREYQVSLPFLYARNLEKWGLFPDRIGNTPISLEQAGDWQFLRFSSYRFNSPDPMLHMLLEAAPEEANLRKSPDFFRISNSGDKIEFISPLNGKIDEAKSSLFTHALKKSGFKFPVTAIGGNPDVKKPYDAGYFLVDSRGNLFRMQMIDAQPSCVNTGSYINEHVRGILVHEHHRKEFYGFIITDNSVFAMLQKNGSLKKLPLPSFSANAFSIALWSDTLHTSFVVQNSDSETDRLYGMTLTDDFDIIHDFSTEPDRRNATHHKHLDQATAFLFPLSIEQDRKGSSFNDPSATSRHFSAEGMAGIIISLALLICFRLLKRHRPKLFDIIPVLLFGFPGLLVTLIIED